MSNFEAKNFFKVYLPKYSFERMSIPPTAVVCSNGLMPMPATATLRNCKGQCRHVELNKCDGRMFFEKGWRRFIDDNSIKEEDILVFSYVGCSVFDVKVYGFDGCEKNVSYLVEEGESGEEQGQEDDEEEDYGYQEEGEDSVLEMEDDDDDDDDYGYLEEGEDSDLEMKREEENEEVLDTLTNRRGQRKINKRNSGLHEGLAAVNDEETTSMEVEYEELNPERYVQELNPYFVARRRLGRGNELYVPSTVIRDYDLILEDNQEITFLDPYDRKKIGKVRKWKDRRTCIIGWRSFCNRNRVNQERDVCICEFLLENENEQKPKFMKVHIIRGKHTKSQKSTLKHYQKKHSDKTLPGLTLYYSNQVQDASSLTMNSHGRGSNRPTLQSLVSKLPCEKVDIEHRKGHEELSKSNCGLL
ncbi:hypothetical protein QUC31_015827 [Theobroma cacao]|uniref:B3 domain-containing protein REM20 isoform X1 n=1 Tax=Theobroma cacao TaxID=3641 RepID=A0AB32VXN4_THECC|nr:PREDICTED: B3 domain-containing protein REM20 isoform X1 [Theobroma cacao]XP_017970170.1 PREDICTED: B3 domain-containing protein REM20 isoform X1 [Theobroma cacao]